MDGAPLALMLSQQATVRLAESGGPHGPTESHASRRNSNRVTPAGRHGAVVVRNRLSRGLRRMADALEPAPQEHPDCHPAH